MILNAIKWIWMIMIDIECYDSINIELYWMTLNAMKWCWKLLDAVECYFPWYVSWYFSWNWHLHRSSPIAPNRPFRLHRSTEHPKVDRSRTLNSRTFRERSSETNSKPMSPPENGPWPIWVHLSKKISKKIGTKLV